MGFRWAHHGRRICRRRADRVACRRNLLSLCVFGWGCSARRRRAVRHALEEERAHWSLIRSESEDAAPFLLVAWSSCPPSSRRRCPPNAPYASRRCAQGPSDKEDGRGFLLRSRRMGEDGHGMWHPPAAEEDGRNEEEGRVIPLRPRMTDATRSEDADSSHTMKEAATEAAAKETATEDAATKDGRVRPPPARRWRRDSASSDAKARMDKSDEEGRGKEGRGKGGRGKEGHGEGGRGRGGRE